MLTILNSNFSAPDLDFRFHVVPDIADIAILLLTPTALGSHGNQGNTIKLPTLVTYVFQNGYELQLVVNEFSFWENQEGLRLKCEPVYW